MRRVVATATLLLLAMPASASLIESTTTDLLEGTPVGHVHYQADAGTESDAPDSCEAALASPLPFQLPVGGSLDGLLVAVDDEVDHYRVPIGQELVGSRLTVSVAGRDATLPLGMDVFMPACGTSVTAEENQPAAALAPPEPAAGEEQVNPHNLDDGYTCSDRWFFVLNQFGGLDAPASIHVAWTDGSREDVQLSKDTPATIAQYATAAHPGFTIESAWANVPAGWEGRFNLSEGFCDAVDGGAVFGEPSEVSGDGTRITFTPIEAGTYMLAVRNVPPAVPEAPAPTPRSCHTFCAAVPETAMDAGGYTASAF